MKIQRHVRQDFQPVYIKLETLREVELLKSILITAYKVDDEQKMLDHEENELVEGIVEELRDVIKRGGILP